ncbi:MAG: DUF2332 family protein [Propionibacteriaceae bacterium]
MADRFPAHAGDAQHVYGYATRGMATDWETAGPIRLVCRGCEKASAGAAIHLRLLAGVFRLVLTDRAPELVAFYPCLGGTAPSYGAWQPLGEVSMEFDPHGPREAKPELRTRLWNPDSGRSVRERLIGTAHDHGVPVTLKT